MVVLFPWVCWLCPRLYGAKGPWLLLILIDDVEPFVSAQQLVMALQDTNVGA